jgi:hypothetical protein
MPSVSLRIVQLKVAPTKVICSNVISSVYGTCVSDADSDDHVEGEDCEHHGFGNNNPAHAIAHSMGYTCGRYPAVAHQRPGSSPGLHVFGTTATHLACTGYVTTGPAHLGRHRCSGTLCDL